MKSRGSELGGSEIRRILSSEGVKSGGSGIHRE